jgi:glycosyltransferase involved in cell wall biosynthesis
VTARPRVAWVVKAWETGGAERMLLDLHPHLRDHVDIVAYAAHATPDDLMPALRAAGIEPRVVGGAAWPGQLRRIVGQEQIDVVHTHGPYAGAFGRAGLLGSKVAVVHTEHSVWSSHRRPTRVLNELTYRRNDAVAAVSNEVAAEIRASHVGRALGARLCVVRNGIDVDIVRADAANDGNLPVDLRTPSYACVGHLRHRKGTDVLLDAAPLIASAIAEVRGFVVGDGEDAAALHDHRRRVGAESVTLLGRRDDARALTARADVFVIPSRVEGMPLALLEAMALARPIVATAVGSIPDLLTSEHDALLVPPENPRALADAVIQLLEDPLRAKTLGQNALRVVEREASAATTAATYLNLYGSAVTERHDARGTS